MVNSLLVRWLMLGAAVAISTKDTASLFVHAAVYSVGPSHTYPTIAAVMEALDGGNDLLTGDVIEIHAKENAYLEKFVINNAGTKASPIVIRSVPDNSSGKLPILDSNGATTLTSQDYWNEPRSLIKVGGAGKPSITAPAAYIRIENLQLQNAHADHGFTDDRGASSSYADNAACVHIEEGSHVEIVNNIITGCGNGIFITPGVSDVLIEGNYIYGNGNVGSAFEHNTYTEALGITYRYNRFGPLCSGCSGNNLKDRSGGLQVAYNVIQGGNRQLDLVDSGNDKILSDGRYRTTYVYGNILLEEDNQGNRQIVHYEGDSDTKSKYRQGTLYFYHNTVVSTRSGRTTLVRLSSEAETCDARNNIIYVTTDEATQLELLAENRGTLLLRNNWIKEDSYLYSFDTSTGSGSVTEMDTLLGEEPGFSDTDYATSFDVSLAGPLGPSAVLAPNVPAVDREYVLHRSSRVRFYEQASDLGAYGHSTIAPSDSGDDPLPTECNFFWRLLQRLLGWLGFSFCK